MAGRLFHRATATACGGGNKRNGGAGGLLSRLVSSSCQNGLASQHHDRVGRRCTTRREGLIGVCRGFAKGSSGSNSHPWNAISPKDVSARQAALAIAIKQVEKSHGKGSVMQLGDRKVANVEVIPTGSLSLDYALGIGGLPKGRVVEVYGMESCGKTTVALHVVAECQKAGGTALFVDAEHALDPAYAKSIGVSIDDLFISQPDNGEQALDIVETLVRSGSVDLVVVDSVAALVPKAELDGEMGDHHIALQARLMSQAMRKLTAALSKTHCLIIFINQIRQKVGVIFGNPDVTTGGNALRFYSSVRLEVRKGQQIKKDGQPIGNECRIKVAKNKLAPPFQKAQLDMLYGTGFDGNGEILDLAVQTGLIVKSGSWFSLSDSFPLDGTELGNTNTDDDGGGGGGGGVPGAGSTMMGQGRGKAKEFIADHPQLREKLRTEVKARLDSHHHLHTPTVLEEDDITTVDGVRDDDATALLPGVAAAGITGNDVNGDDGLLRVGGDIPAETELPIVFDDGDMEGNDVGKIAIANAGSSSGGRSTGGGTRRTKKAVQ